MNASHDFLLGDSGADADVHGEVQVLMLIIVIIKTRLRKGGRWGRDDRENADVGGPDRRYETRVILSGIALDQTSVVFQKFAE